MRVTFRQSGGFGGLSFGADLDTATLPAAQARTLRKLVAASGIGTLAAEGPGGARDLATYEIEVEDGGATTKATFDDMSVPAELEPLLEFLRARARARPLGP